MNPNQKRDYGSKYVTLVMTASATALALWFAPQVDEAQAADYTVLDLSQVEHVFGGVSTDIKWPTGGPWGQSYDNLRFNVDVENHFGTPSATIYAYADDTKVGYETVSTPAPAHTGSLHRRYDWPLAGTRDLQLKFVHDKKIYLTGNEPTLTDQYLLDTVKVHTVKFWNAVSPSLSTNVPSSVSKSLVDNLEAPIPDRMTSVDGIYAENCGVGTKTQWRHAGVGTAQLTDTCIDMFANGGTYAGCLDDFNDNYSTDTANVHVVWVKSNQNSGAAGAHWMSGNKYLITLREDWTANPDLDALLAHELGHTYIGGHTNSIYDCSGSRPRENRNLMCSNVGRVMDADQCASAQASNRYTDRN